MSHDFLARAICQVNYLNRSRACEGLSGRNVQTHHRFLGGICSVTAVLIQSKKVPGYDFMGMSGIFLGSSCNAQAISREYPQIFISACICTNKQKTTLPPVLHDLKSTLVDRLSCTPATVCGCHLSCYVPMSDLRLSTHRPHRRTCHHRIIWKEETCSWPVSGSPTATLGGRVPHWGAATHRSACRRRSPHGDTGALPASAPAAGGLALLGLLGGLPREVSSTPAAAFRRCSSFLATICIVSICSWEACSCVTFFHFLIMSDDYHIGISQLIRSRNRCRFTHNFSAFVSLRFFRVLFVL